MSVCVFVCVFMRVYLFVWFICGPFCWCVCVCSGVMQDSQKAAAVARSFSLSWRGNGEPPAAQEPMRFRSATTTGTPAVEKARNNVRQKASG